MTLVVTWLLFPLLLSALALGAGLLLEWAAGLQLPGAVLLPAGFAVVIVVASFTTMSARTAGVTTPLVVALAVAGYGLGLPLRRRVDPWAVAAGAGVMAVYAAPIVLSGSATFAGYISLDDTSTWLALADNAVTHGRSVAGLLPSTYSVVLNDDLGSGYPIGAFVPLGIGHQLTGQDAAWLFQPYVAFLAVLLALSIYSLLAPLIRRGWLRALVAFLGAQPALLYGYAFWSGIKEITVAFLLALLVALAVTTLRKPWRSRATLPVAVGGAAVLACLSVLGAVWFIGFAALALLLATVHGSRKAGISLAVLVACGLVLSIPALATARLFVRVAGQSDVANSALGNLIHPLSRLQIFGIWPVGDFRQRPAHLLVTYLLIAVLAATASYGVLAAVRSRAWGVALYVLVAVGGCFLVIAFDAVGHGSPWLDGKALASASPSLVVAGLAGAAILFERGLRSVAIPVAAAIACGVIWSNALTYGSVWLAPQAQLAELETIGGRFAGDGPALMTEYQPYGVRHFLRSLDAEGASERRARPVELRDGGVLGKSQYADLDVFDLNAILAYRMLVLRRSPVESRPPSAFVPVWAGRWYEVWRQLPEARRILEHLSLGDEQQPVAAAPCREVRRLAELAAQNGGTLVAAVRPPAQVVDLAVSKRPSSWQAGEGQTFIPTGAGTAAESFTVSRAGSYAFWLGGSFRGRVRLVVDGGFVGSATDQLEEPAQATPLGRTRLSPGRHVVELRYDQSGLRPGASGAGFLVGPLEIGLPATAARLVDVAPSDAASLCGRRLDWIEALAP